MAKEVAKSNWDNQQYEEFLYLLTATKWKNVRTLRELNKN